MSPTLTAKKPRRPPSKQVPEKEAAPMNATAAKLLVAAGDLMIERNSTEVSLSEIAQKSGVNAALVKYHFGN
ncbi:TetR/AcrR family transcriptional regulator, partial [Acinetobacter baumannii]